MIERHGRLKVENRRPTSGGGGFRAEKVQEPSPGHCHRSWLGSETRGESGIGRTLRSGQEESGQSWSGHTTAWSMTQWPAIQQGKTSSHRVNGLQKELGYWKNECLFNAPVGLWKDYQGKECSQERLFQLCRKKRTQVSWPGQLRRKVKGKQEVALRCRRVWTTQVREFSLLYRDFL